MYEVPADLVRSLGRKRPGPFSAKNTAADIGGFSPSPLAPGVPGPERRNPALDPTIDPGIAFLGGSGISRRALGLVSRLAAIRGTAAHDELIAAGVLSVDDYWACLAAYLGLPFVTADDALTMVPAARHVPSEALRRADRLMVTDNGESFLLLAPAGAMLSRLRASVERAPHIVKIPAG